jgi:uncharacterized protein YodC (DUF2158 family)
LQIGGILTGNEDGTHKFHPLPHGDHDIINPSGLTVLVGTGGPRQTVINTGKLDGPLRVYQSPQKTPGVSQQTVYTPTGGLTVLVGTGGPHQTVQTHGGSHSSRSENDCYNCNDYDGLSPQERKKYDDRGDQPGYIINPGQIGEKKDIT